jgi:hypothetical protein
MVRGHSIKGHNVYLADRHRPIFRGAGISQIEPSREEAGPQEAARLAHPVRKQQRPAGWGGAWSDLMVSRSHVR